MLPFLLIEWKRAAWIFFSKNLLSCFMVEIYIFFFKYMKVSKWWNNFWMNYPLKIPVLWWKCLALYLCTRGFLMLGNWREALALFFCLCTVWNEASCWDLSFCFERVWESESLSSVLSLLHGMSFQHGDIYIFGHAALLVLISVLICLYILCAHVHLI